MSSRPLIMLLLTALMPSVASAQDGQSPILHEFFVVDRGFGRPGQGRDGAAAGVGEPIHTPSGAVPPGGFHPDRPGARNAPIPGADDLSLDRDTEREGWLTYYAVFEPTVAPFKRTGVRDAVVEERGELRLTIADESLQRLRVSGRDPGDHREVFVGTALLDLRPGALVPIPSVSADMVIHRYESDPTAGFDFFVDSAGNTLARAEHEGQVRLEYLVSSPRGYFGGPMPAQPTLADVPRRLRPIVPASVLPTATRAMQLLGLTPESSVADLVSITAAYFRSFRGEPFPPEEWTDDIYRDILFGGRGVCRHRTFAFVVTLQAWGVPARYVYNEAHTFAEVYLPDLGWRRIDLGGDAAGLHVLNASSTVLHAAPDDDPLPTPEGFEQSYSRQVRDGLSGDDGAATPSPRPAEGPSERAGASGSGEPIDMAGWDSGDAEPMDLADLAEYEPFDEPPPAPRQATVIVLRPTSEQVYRGEPLRVEARLETADGIPLAGRSLRVFLGPPSGSDRGRLIELGGAETDASGAIQADLIVPHSLPLGRWGVYLDFVGDADYAPSRSP